MKYFSVQAQFVNGWYILAHTWVNAFESTCSVVTSATLHGWSHANLATCPQWPVSTHSQCAASSVGTMQASKHFQPVYGTAQDDDVSGYLSRYLSRCPLYRLPAAACATP